MLLKRVLKINWDNFTHNKLEVSRIKTLEHQTLKRVLFNAFFMFFFNSFLPGFRQFLLK